MKKLELLKMLNEKKEGLKTLSIDFMNCYSLDCNSYIDDALFEFVDGMVDIYYYDLKNWVVNNVEAIEYMEKVIDECLFDPRNYDFYKHIQCAQFEQYREEIYQEMEDILQCLALEYLIDNFDILGLEELDLDIETLLDEVDFNNNDRFSNLKDDIYYYLEDLKEE